MIAFIINPISGGVRPEAARTRAELASAVVDRHGDPAEVFVTERPGHARELAKAAVARGARLVMAWGGDGTINEVASALVFGEVPLGIVPAGSGNGLARQLSIPQKPVEAIQRSIGAEPRRIDVGEMGDRLFVNVAGIGFDAYVAWKFNEAGAARRGLVTYASISSRALLSYQPATYTITTNDDEPCASVRAVLVTVANSPEFGNGAIIAPGAQVDDGRLDLVVMEERSRLNTIAQLPRLFRGTVDKARGCSLRRITRATIESSEPMKFHVDGEPVLGGTSLRVRVQPGALYVAV
ncbi:MAG TPA: diacylglycerol kinase family protein [Vicinamibacterales bacterium]|nr:diacylglycerol kinase family protein [Vicinamibacterales bacterium]